VTLETADLLAIAGVVLPILLAVGGGALAWMKSDIRDLRTEMRADMQDLRAEIRADMQDLWAEMRADMQKLRTETHADMQDLRTETHADMQDLRTEIRAVNSKVDALTQAILASALIRDPLTAASEAAAP
jgi:chromosome segregation ATPase